MQIKQETFLSYESNYLADNLWSDLSIWSGNISTEDYTGPRAKSFSTMLSSSVVFLYDHPEALKKYPNGFYSENTSWVPITMYERLRECEPLCVKTKSLNSYWNLAGLIFIPFLTKMVEKKYGVLFTDKEKEDILLSSVENTFDKTGYITGDAQTNSEYIKTKDKDDSDLIKKVRSEEFTYCSSIESVHIKSYVKEIFQNGDPEFLSNEDVASWAEELGLKSKNFIRNLTTDNNFIDYALLKNIDMYEPNHPFNKLIEKVRLPHKAIDLLDISKENLRKTINNLPPSQTYVLYSAFDSLSYKIVSESNDVESLLRNVSGVWANIALETNNVQFEKILNILTDTCATKFPCEDDDFHLDPEVMTKLAHTINDNQWCGPLKRASLIGVITKYAEINSTVRTILFTQKSTLKLK